MRTPIPPLGPQHQVPVSVPSLETSDISFNGNGNINGNRNYFFTKMESKSGI